MKKLTALLISLMAISGAWSQTVDDALRYSQLFYTGTARFMSMGGAFTALGGDVSTLSQNPAGIGVFRSSEVTITPQMYKIQTSALLNGTSNKDYIYNFNLGQAGVVLNMLNNNTTTGLLNLNFGYSFNKTNNLSQTVTMKGTGAFSSMADYWSDISSGYFKDELADNVPEAFLAWDTWLIDTLSGSNINYGTVFSNYGDNPPSVYGQKITRSYETEGYTGEHALSIGGNYSDKVIFGATLGITRLTYSSNYSHQESTNEILPSQFSNFTYTFHYDNTSTGYGLKLGAIIKPVEIVRIGVAFHSPTVYKIDEYLYDNMTSGFRDGGKYTSTNNPVRYNYRLTTPFRALVGAAVQIKKIGLLSADYEFIDYSTARFSETGDGYDYAAKNETIKNGLRSTANLRLGGEVRLNKFYLRGGYGMYGKPFSADDINRNISYNALSFGAGFREQNIFVDFSYSDLMNSQKYILYDSSAETLTSDWDISRKMFTVTFGYKFVY